MNSKRKADLQRRLGMAPVVTPPPDLADRIKARIPENFGETSRPRRGWLNAFNLRIAASIVLLVSSAYVGIRFLSGTGLPKGESARPVTIARPANAVVATQVEAPQPSAPRPDRAPADTSPEAVAFGAPRSTTLTQSADTPRRQRETATTPAPQVAAAPAAPPPAMQELAAESAAPRQIADARAEAVTPLPAPPPPPAAAPAPAAVNEPAAVVGAVTGANAEMKSRDAGAIAPSREVQARPAVVAQKTEHEAAARVAIPRPPGEPIVVIEPAPGISTARTLFGVSVDRTAVDRVRTALDSGRKPAANSVDVEALVNYFAGTPESSPSDVALEIEASRAPIEKDGRTFVIRYTIDTARTDGAAGREQSVATDARITTVFNPQVVLSSRLLGDGASASSEATLQKNLSVTVVYEVVLRDTIRSIEQVASVVLKYRSTADAKQATINKAVRVADLERPWGKSSRRHRLATLGASWGEALKLGGSAAEVAHKAEELSAEAPRDARAHELATMATASSRLQSSGSTGSGR